MRTPAAMGLVAGLLSGLPWACGESVPRQMLEAPEPGLEASPRWLAYTCVEPGCDTTLRAEVGVVGDRAVAVKRIVLSDRDRQDFVVRAEREAPFVLEPAETFGLEVDYRPTGDPRLTDARLRITYGDASSDETEDRIEPGELEIPLVRRLVGEPKLTVTPSSLTFGPVVAPGQKALDLAVENTGFGNVGLVLDEIRTDPADVVRVENAPSQALLPGERWNLSVVYAPTAESILEGLLSIRPAGSNGLPTVVPLLGTSISTPRLVTEPEETIDFGPVTVGSSATAELRLSNLGAVSLEVSGVDVFEPVVGPLSVTLPGGQQTTTSSLAALASQMLEVHFRASVPGAVNGRLEIITTDPDRPRAVIWVRGLAAQPELVTEPTQLDFGTVPRGWTIVQPIEVRNAGYGDLVITNVSLILGSSDLFTLRTRPALPAVLRHDERLGLEIEFRSEAAATFSGTLSIDTSDPVHSFAEIPLSATGASCEEGCPIANGEPSCSAGICEIGSCAADWYDADGDASNGCECAELDRDPGGFCAEGTYIGQINDDGSTRTFRGILPEEGDTDVIRFFGFDGSEFLDDDFDVRVSLDSTDPSIRFCIRRHRTDRHLSECFPAGQNCPDSLSYRDDGSLGTDDSADYVIEVKRDGGAAPTCTPYTLFIRNG